MSMKEDLIYITVYGIDISILEKSTEDLQDQLLDFLLAELPKSMYAFKKDTGVGYDCGFTTGDICASIETHPEDSSRRKVIFLKEGDEIVDREKAGEFIVKTANFFGQQLIDQLN